MGNQRRTIRTGAAVAVAVVAGSAVAATTGTTSAAGAASAVRAPVTVTIQAQGTDIHGTVASTRPVRCAANRTVRVYRLIAGEPHLWSSDTTQRVGGRYVWSTGNTGTTGRFFAVVAPKPGCRGDTSPTITVRR